MKNNSKQLNKKSSLTIGGLLLFLTSGILAGFLSLILSVLLDLSFGEFTFWASSGFLFVLLLVLGEELIKFFLLSFLFVTPAKSNLANIVKGLFFGLGFGVFEFILITAENSAGTLSPVSILSIILVHSITSIILIISINKLKNKQQIFIFYFLLAIFLHLIYNLSIISY